MSQGTCSIEGCPKPSRARTWCSLHYKRWQQHGDPLWVPWGTVEERFWSKVQKGEPGECWIWDGALDFGGYGRFNTGGCHIVAAHRLAYEWIIGPIPDGLQLDHLCRVRACVNPDHLEPVTGRENRRRGEGWSGVNARKTECDNGHLFDEKNTYVHPVSESRSCRKCHVIQVRKSRSER